MNKNAMPLRRVIGSGYGWEELECGHKVAVRQFHGKDTLPPYNHDRCANCGLGILGEARTVGIKRVHPACEQDARWHVKRLQEQLAAWGMEEEVRRGTE